MNRWPWPVKPLYWVYYCFDWLDNKGDPDHGKVQVDLVIWAALALHYVGKAIELGQLIVLLSAAFGARVYLAFLKSKAVTVTHSVKRDEVEGIEPTP